MHNITEFVQIGITESGDICDCPCHRPDACCMHCVPCCEMVRIPAGYTILEALQLLESLIARPTLQERLIEHKRNKNKNK